MTKAELVEVVAAQSRLTKKSAAEILDIVFANIGKAVKKDQRFSYPGFGTWSVRSPQGAEDPQPADQRDDEAQGLEDDRLPARQGAEELAVARGAPRARSGLTEGVVQQDGAPLVFQRPRRTPAARRQAPHRTRWGPAR